MAGMRLALRVTPKAGRNAVDGLVRDAKGALMLKARVSAPPEDGKANAALIDLLAETFAVPKKAVTIISGAAARTKHVQILGDDAVLAARLKEIGAAS